MNYLIVNGDCRRVLGDLEGVDAVVTDPPYGMGWDTDSTRFSGGILTHRNLLGEGRSDWGDVCGDAGPFDPMPWLECRRVILFGANHYGDKLPTGTTLIWVKRNDWAFGSFLSDAEIAWMKGGHGVYAYKDLSMNQLGGGRVHPTQKPVALMRWCIRRLRLDPGSLILDPYMGSGTTLIAALAEGHRAIGIEIDPRYCEIARRRIERPHARIPRPGREEPMPLFDTNGCG